MPRTAIRVALAGVLLLPLGQAAAHDEGVLTDTEARAVERAIASVVRDGVITESTPARLDQLDRLLAGVKRGDSGAIRALKAFRDLKREGQDEFTRELDRVWLLRSLKEVCPNPARLAFHLGDQDETSVSQGLIEAGCLPFDSNFPKVAGILSTSANPVVRLASGVLARACLNFGGDRDACVRIATNILVDPDPSVAAYFGLIGPYGFRDRELIDKWVSRFGDERLVPGGRTGPLSIGTGTVGKAMIQGFGTAFFVHRGTSFDDDEFLAKMKRSENWSRATLEEWWKANEKAWDFGPPATAGWVKEFDGTTVCAVGKPVSVKGTSGGIQFMVAEYSLTAQPGLPRGSVDCAVIDDGQGGAGPPGVVAGAGSQVEYLASIGGGGSDTAWLEVLPMPTADGEVRVRWWYWTRSAKPVRK
jgi:hypothetical protein